MAKLSERKEG